MSSENQFCLTAIMKTYATSAPPRTICARHEVSRQTLWNWRNGLVDDIKARHLVIALRHNAELHAALLRDLPSSSAR